MDVTDVRQRLQERVVPLALGQYSLQVQAEHVSTQFHLWALQCHAGLGLGQEAFEAFVANEREDDGSECVEHGDVVDREVEELREVVETVAKVGLKSIAIDVFAHGWSMFDILIFYTIGRREKYGCEKGMTVP